MFLNEPLKAETVERTTWQHSTQGGCTVAVTAAVYGSVGGDEDCQGVSHHFCSTH